jgi:CheY-like chemotaxis protein
MESMEIHKTLRDDIRIIYISLHFVNDFLRSMLDIHRAASKKIELKLAPVDIRKDVLDPVSNMLYQRDTNIVIEVICPENLIVETDSLRLKQVILNLGRNSSKFVDKGFIRIRSDVVDGCVELYVEDSGPGIPMSKRHNLFSNYHTSLDSIGQGMGFGLSLCKSLMTILEGGIWLDDTYDSGVEGCPGARFVVRLNSMQLPMTHFDQIEPLKSMDNDLKDNITSPKDETGSVGCTPDEADLKDAVGGNESKAIIPDELPKSLKVLFVDDDLMLRKLFIRAVKKVAPDWSLDEAASGESAIKMIEDRSSSDTPGNNSGEVFDLVFMDMYMSSTEKQLLGTETIRALRSKGVQSILCGLSANDLEPEYIASGADAFILKPMPCKPDSLKAELLRVIASGKGHHPCE